MQHKAAPHEIGSAPRTRTFNIWAAILAGILSTIAIVIVGLVFEARDRIELEHDHYARCAAAANELLIASDYLTTQARMYVMTGDREYLDNYIRALFVANERNEAVKTLKEELPGSESFHHLFEANRLSNDLTHVELYAMYLYALATHLSPIPEELARTHVGKNDLAIPDDKKLARAEELLVGDGYHLRKGHIIEQIDLCTSGLVEYIRAEQQRSSQHLDMLLGSLRIIIVLLLAIVVASMIVNIQLVLLPMLRYVESIKHGEKLKLVGAREVRYVAAAYNTVYEENRNRTALLQQEAEHDALTGLLNRGSFDKLITQLEGNLALLLLDVDLFKHFNDEYGHEVGDAVLRRVGETISQAFRTSDFTFRIGGDEFAVIMTDLNSSQRDVVTTKIANITKALRGEGGDVPAVTLSIGIAFTDETEVRSELFNSADAALYEVKRSGRNSYAFFSPAS